jgi:LysM repeat protein
MVRLIRAVWALLVLVALLVGFPVLLVATIGNPWPAGGLDELELMTNSAVLGLVSVLGWFFWAQVVLCTLWEIPAALRGIEAPRVPIALGGQQHAIRWLVHTILAVGVTSSVLAPSVASRAEAAPVALSHTVTHVVDHAGPAADTTLTDTRHTDQKSAARDTQHHRTAKGALPRVTTVKGDTLWGLAQTHLGDGFRWREIADLNHGQKMSDGRTFTNPRNIEPRWELRLPADATNLPGTGTEQEVVVEPGDTLFGIAGDELGNANLWPNLYEENKDVIGLNPDLIHPGQVLELPAARAGNHEKKPADTTGPIGPTGPTGGQGPGDPEGADRPLAAEIPGEPTQAPDTPAGPAVTEPSEPGSSTSSSGEAARSTASEREDQGGFSALRALLASAVCLSFGALTLVAVNRRRPFRQRRPGRTIAATPHDLIAVERAVVENGVGAQVDVEFLDRALRHVAASCRAGGASLPQLGAAVLGQEDLTLLFLHPAVGEVPTGWTATDDARAWMLPRWTFLEDELLTQPAPYPALVTIGHDEGGRTWLLDLETLGVFGIAGARQQVAARSMAASRSTCRNRVGFSLTVSAPNPSASRTSVPSDQALTASSATRNRDRSATCSRAPAIPKTPSVSRSSSQVRPPSS